MTAKEYLEQARRTDRRICALLERRRHCEELARGRQLAALDALEAEIDRQIEDYAARARQVEAAIDAVEDEACRDVLRYRYLNGWRWRVIANQMNYSTAWLRRLHDRGLEEVRRARGLEG